MSNIIILLTACINPNGMAYTALQDKDERLRQYKSALEWYLENTSNKIVFVENTGFDISSMYGDYVNSGRLEVLTFQGNNFDKSKGKGFGEAIIIDYAIKNSKIISEGSVVVKITGRHRCLNINKVTRCCNDYNTVYAALTTDNRGVECDSRVFVCPIEFLKNFFLPRMDELNDTKGYHFEYLLFDSSKEWMKRGFKFKEFWFPIDILGICGSTGTLYNRSFKKKIGFYFHFILHKFGYFGPLAFWKNGVKK